MIIKASAHATILSVLPDIWMVAHNGIQKPATPSDTPFFLVCSNVTGMVAADDWVPSAVKYAGIMFQSSLKGFLRAIAPAMQN